MSRLLESYVAGQWYAAPDAGTPLPSAVDGSEVARISATGIDLAEMVTYAREVGGPALSAMTFHERLKRAQGSRPHVDGRKSRVLHTLHCHRCDDARFRGGHRRRIRDPAELREQGSARIARQHSLSGRKRRASRQGRNLPRATHLYITSRRRRADQRLQFPGVGFLEKLAPAFIAGVPSIVKPASSTAYLTELVFRRIIESGLLPEGSVQLLSGSARGLLDHLGGQDSVAFTGSADTAATLRAHPNVVGKGVHFNAEADSLNASILGEDAVPGTPEFDLYVKQLVTEMTVKAGQKCTAIRRALVPLSLVDAVVDAASERLNKVVVGHPDADGVTMGALASIEQRDEVLKSIRGLTKSATIVFGDPDNVDVVGADGQSGAFLSPVLLRAEENAHEVHELEAFGPVSTVIGYDGIDHAIELAARGEEASSPRWSLPTPTSHVDWCWVSQLFTAECSC